MVSTHQYRDDIDDQDDDQKSLGDRIASILPSYPMHQSTISRALTPPNVNFREDPPSYDTDNKDTSKFPAELLPLNSETSGDQGHNMFYFDGESAVDWENTIVGNVYKMERLNNISNSISKYLDVDIKITKKVGKKGVAPEFYNTQNLEFSQGKYIHGYVKVRNNSNVPIPFDIFHVSFEGVTLTLDNNELVVTNDIHLDFKFLTMVDLFASWSYSNIARLSTDEGDPHDWCLGDYDPYDNSELSIDVKRIFQPHVTYKRFFTFRIPDKLLDDVCDIHNIPSHSIIPPTLGVPRGLYSTSEMLSMKDKVVKDFASLDSSITFSVYARIIGKASDYGVKKVDERDKYVVAKDSSIQFRLIPRTNIPETHDLKWTNIYFDALLRQLDDLLDRGRKLMNSPSKELSNFSLSPVNSRNSELKFKQLFSFAPSPSKSKNEKDIDTYGCIIPYRKKSLAGRKTLGSLSVLTPKENYSIPYVGPCSPDKDCRIPIPLEICFAFQKDQNVKEFPEVKCISAGLVVLNIGSRDHPIPIEFTHDMCFRDHETDNFKSKPSNITTILIDPFKRKVEELRSIHKKVGPELLPIEVLFYKDIKCVASLRTKTVTLPLSKVSILKSSTLNSGIMKSVEDIPWESDKSPLQDHTFLRKRFNILVDLGKQNIAIQDKVTKKQDFYLVPSFQSCMFTRIYYLTLTLKLTNNDSTIFHVPITIENK